MTGCWFLLSLMLVVVVVGDCWQIWVCSWFGGFGDSLFLVFGIVVDVCVAVYGGVGGGLLCSVGVVWDCALLWFGWCSAVVLCLTLCGLW